MLRIRFFHAGCAGLFLLACVSEKPDNESGAQNSVEEPSCNDASIEEEPTPEASVGGDASVEVDAGVQDPMSGAVPNDAGYYRTWCDVEHPVCVDGKQELWPEVCFADIAQYTSSSIGASCVVDATGRLGVINLGGSIVITNEGWTHSGRYPGSGPVRSTLSDDDEARCTEALGELQRTGCAAPSTAAGGALSPPEDPRRMRAP